MSSTVLVDTIKLATNFAVSSGVSTMIGYAAKSSVPKIAPFAIRNRPVLVKGWKIFHKIAIPAGAAALAGMAADQAVKHTDKQIDEYVALFDAAVQTKENIGKIKKDKTDKS